MIDILNSYGADNGIKTLKGLRPNEHRIKKRK